MTNHELLQQIKNSCSLNDFLLAKQLIIHLSKNINNECDLINNSFVPISFKIKKFNKLLKKVIKQNYPLAYITKKVNFLDLELFINKKTFIPRPETQYWLEQLFPLLENKKKSVLELCSGCGAIAFALEQKFSHYNITALEKSFYAIKAFKKNAKVLNSKIKIIRCDLTKKITKLKQKFDIILCNPPYIAFNDSFVQQSLKFEPSKALYAKDNGLYFYKKIISNLDYICNKNALVVFEIGFNQACAVKQIILQYNIKNFFFIKDYNKNDRLVYFYKE